MEVLSLTNGAKATRVSDAVAAGITTIDSSGIDMSGFESVEFEVLFGAITPGAVTSVKAQQSSDNGAGDAWADLAGTSLSVADDDDNKVFLLSVPRPQKRYVRCVVLRATQNAVVDGIVARQIGARTLPVTHDAATVGGSETNVSPDEGVA